MSEDNPNKPLNFITEKWDITDAVGVIRWKQKEAHELGFNLCLGGGVLNNGYSLNDLDIIAIPRPMLSKENHDFNDAVARLLDLFGGHQGKSAPVVIYPPTRTVYTCYPTPGRPRVELIVLSQFNN